MKFKMYREIKGGRAIKLNPKFYRVLSEFVPPENDFSLNFSFFADTYYSFQIIRDIYYSEQRKRSFQ